jgi:hypothetical protein
MSQRPSLAPIILAATKAEKEMKKPLRKGQSFFICGREL